MLPLSGGGNPPQTPGDMTKVESETKKSKGQGVREKREIACCEEEEEERGKTKQGNGKGKIT